MLDAIASAEQIIVSAIERECEALRSGQMLAAKALHTRLCDAARVYLNATRAARISIVTIERVSPGICERLEERRMAFASLLKVELAILAAERAAVFENDAAAANQIRNSSRAPQKAGLSRKGAAPRLVAISGDGPRDPSARRAG